MIKKTSSTKILGAVLAYVVLGLFTLWIFAPFSIVLSVSVKGWHEANNVGFTYWPREGFDFSGYKDALTAKSYGTTLPSLIRGLLNTLMYIIPPTLLGLFTSSVAAYAFAKLRFKAKGPMFAALIASMLIPGTIMIAPTYSLFTTINWVDTPLPLMVPGMSGAAACVFFMRQYYMGIPDALIEAAKLDGMGYWAIFFKIMVPLSVPALLAQGILGFVGGYNDYFGPYLYLQTAKLQTLQLTLNGFFGAYGKSTNVIMAASVLVLLPTLIIYAVAQKYFIEGIATSGMKL